MPIYAYECTNGHRFERVKSIRVSDRQRENDKCDVCAAKAKLVPSRTGAPILVGSGFFCNDYQQPTRS